MDKAMSLEEELLRKLRGHMAYKKRVEPYKVFRDIELELLLKHRPTTIEELSSIKGFPPLGKRVEGFGEAIIKIFTKSIEVEDFTIDGDEDNMIIRVKTKKLDFFS